MKKILFIAVLSWIYLSLEAQQKPDLFKEDSIRHKELQEVTVTGQHRPQSVKNSVFQVKIINRAHPAPGCHQIAGCIEQ
jgi:hypothetical protein